MDPNRINITIRHRKRAKGAEKDDAHPLLRRDITLLSGFENGMTWLQPAFRPYSFSSSLAVLNSLTITLRLKH